jgi:hypothetical protein
MKVDTFFAYCLIAVMLAIVPVSNSYAQQAEMVKAYKIKAAFLLNFDKFIHWPEDSFDQNSNSFNICVLGESPFGSDLYPFTSRSISRKKIDLQYISTVNQAKNCQLLFVSTSEKENLDDIQTTLGDQAIAMVSDIKGFTRSGGTIEFVSQENKLSFIINLRRAREQELEIHSALLNLASEVIQ